MKAPDLITLSRIGSTPWGTFGVLRLPDGAFFATVEPQWRHNARGESCIPSGVYPLAMRSSPIVAKTSAFEFQRGWEVQDVPDRSLIMIHPGNWEKNSNGCVLVGRAHVVLGGKPGVSASRAAFKDLMQRLGSREDWRIDIKWTSPEQQCA